MRFPFILIFISFFLAFCSSDFEFESISSGVSSDESQEDAELEEDEEEITAVRPAVISGSYLVCEPVGKNEANQTLDISCHFEKEDGTVLTEIPLVEGDLEVVNEHGENVGLGFAKNSEGKVFIQAILDESSHIKITLKSLDGVEIDAPQEDEQRLIHIISAEEIVLTPEEVQIQGEAKLEEQAPDEASVNEETTSQQSEEKTSQQSEETAQAEVESEVTEEAELNCDAMTPQGGWLLVPGDLDYQTEDFCVMKYEAKCSLENGESCSTVAASESPISQANGSPWANISQLSAITECESLGPGYRLIGNQEWMTISTNAASISENWSNSLVGDGELNRGHSDANPDQGCAANLDDSLAYVEGDCSGLNTGTFNQRRTHLLSTGKVIWDMAGNVREWVDEFIPDDKPAPNVAAYSESPDVTGTASMPKEALIPTNAVKPFWNDSWTSAQSIGQYESGIIGTGGALSRGGDRSGRALTGLFYARLAMDQNYSNFHIGFRCVYSVP